MLYGIKFAVLLTTYKLGEYVMEKKKAVLKKGFIIALLSVLVIFAAAGVYSIIAGRNSLDIFSADDGRNAMVVEDPADSETEGDSDLIKAGSNEEGTTVSEGANAGAADEYTGDDTTESKADNVESKTDNEAGLKAEVVAKEDTPLELNIDDLTIVEGVRLRAVPEKSSSGESKDLVWTSSDDTVAIVDGNGNITGVNGGYTIITCRTASGEKEDTVNVTVIDPPDGGAVGSDDPYKNKYIPKLTSREFAIADKDISISNERFSMTIPKGALYPGKIESYILKWMELIEEASGLSLYPDGWKNRKITINISKGGAAYGSSDGITVAEMDLLTDETAAAYVYMHELSHTLDFRNSGTNLQPFTESFAILNSCKAFELSGRDDLAQELVNRNYWPFPIEDSNLDNFEEYYTNVDGWDAYITGFKFSFYLQQEFGENILTDIMKKWRSKYGENSSEKPKSEFINIIKECTSENVFSDFRNWYQKNNSLYQKWNNVGNDLFLANGITETMCLPVINETYQGFTTIYKFGNVDSLLLDFYEAFFVSQFHGFSAKGIFGECYTSTDAIISYYDADWNFICARKLEAGSGRIEVWGAARMLVKGNGGYFNFKPEFKQMMEK